MKRRVPAITVFVNRREFIAHQGATITPAEVLASGGENGDARVWLKKAGPDTAITEPVTLREGDEFFTT